MQVRGGGVKKGANTSLTNLFKDADSLLDSIDKFMENYKDSNKDFYAGYKAARVIRDLGIRHNGEEEEEEPEFQGQAPAVIAKK
ncbi:MAG: hypothetical protein IPL53_04065 [Ignavibacteria bacterium]|nr:hypothetical protein [Ignavibacteria bacterium]